MAEGTKTFINHTDKDLNITMFIRAGDSPQDEGGTEMVSVAKHSRVEAVYEGVSGSAGYVYLNSLLFEWQEGNNMTGVSQKVVTRGDGWDNTLNTNSTVTITSLTAGDLHASGSNQFFPIIPTQSYIFQRLIDNE